MSEYDDRIHHQGYQEIGADENSQELQVTDQRFHAGGAYGVCYQAHDAQGREVNDPGHHFGDRLRYVIEPALGGAGCNIFHSQADDDRPGQDTDVVRREQRIHRVVHHVQNQIVEHRDNVARRRQLRICCHLQVQSGRKQEGHGYAHERRTESRHHVKPNNRLHGSAISRFLLGHGIHDQEEYQNRRHAFQRFDEQVPENFDHRNRRREANGDEDADRQPHHNLLDQCHTGEYALNSTKHNHFLLLSKKCISRCLSVYAFGGEVASKGEIR